MKGRWIDLGRMAYAEALAVQERVAAEVVDGSPDTLLLVEHDPVYTLGAGFHDANLLLTPEEYARRGIAVTRTGRGGDVTYHGPGQLVAYPIFDLKRHGQDLHRWLRGLEEALILALAEYGVEARRFPPHTGVWVADRKVASIGVKVRRWVSMHGVALNCCNDLTPFQWIVPCGIQEYGMTSLSELLGRHTPPSEVAPAVLRGLARAFDLDGFEPAPVP